MLLSTHDGSGAGPVASDEHADDELVTWWGLVIEGYHGTQNHLMKQLARQLDLTPGSSDILIRLLRSPGRRLPMTQLAKEVALSSGGFTKVADRLAAAGLIRREPCETDRRVTYAVLTEHGTDLAERARALCAEVLRERVLQPLGAKKTANLADAMRILRTTNSTN